VGILHAADIVVYGGKGMEPYGEWRCGVRRFDEVWRFSEPNWTGPEGLRAIPTYGLKLLANCGTKCSCLI
jgi:hypothetical protein